MKWYSRVDHNFHNPNQDRQPDQIFLKEYIWPLIKNNHMAHIALEKLRYNKEDILTEFVPRFIGKPIQPKIKI